MDLKEKKLYHQIHPLKLLTDWITGGISLYLLWFHQLTTALLVMFIPSIVVSIMIVKYGNLEKIKKSTFGNYMKRTMITWMEIVRLAGFVIMIIGAWLHIIWLIIFGLLIILFGWIQGRVTQ
ncbi:MAG TPA: hypothetical protein VK100_07810 [Pseudogracilibacillus sp.]|nr:hypothetical protein [Pseudogracilibacillus sp.]